jgi:two-component system chemotaxis sensor kinase CheA
LAGKPAHATPVQEQMAIVISAAANRAGYALMIDAIEGTEEIVVKPLSPVLRHVPVYGGNAVLGDGRTVLILDPAGLAQAMGIDGERDEKEKEAKEEAVIEPMEQLLVFRSGAGAPCAVRLSCVMRLEKFSPADISPAGKGLAVSYRGKVMPLVPFAPSVSSVSPAVRGRGQTVIVLGQEPRLTGLMVDDIVDIIEAPAAAVSALQGIGGDGILGSTVIAGKVMDILDARQFMHAGTAAP